MDHAPETPSVWRLRYDVVSIRVMLLLVGGIRNDDLKPEVHLYLGDRYERLAAQLARRGVTKRANRLGEKALWHYARGGRDDSPRAAAMAMPVPRPRLFTDAPIEVDRVERSGRRGLGDSGIG